ncbi:MAG: septal ring lytic transglycosylase RlpA family protein [Treponema sp.]|jgi:rare lipoprotein A|nr:septal ring lytic transglycosylase RlpA family protein [Treponema sp.]
MKRIATVLILVLIFITIAIADGAYMRNFQQRGSATFEIESSELIAAHPSLPTGTPVTITNLQNQRKVVVTVVERTAATARRIIDLSWGAAIELEATVDDIIPITLYVDRIRTPGE